MLTCPGLNLVQPIFSCMSAPKNLHVNLSLITAGHQDLSQHVKASFSQSEDVFYKSHITIHDVINFDITTTSRDFQLQIM